MKTGVGRKKFGRFIAAASRATVRLAAIQKVTSVGFPLLSEFIQSGVRELAKEGDSSAAVEIGDMVANALDKLTEFAQNIQAEISGTLKTTKEGFQVASGFALTGQDLRSLPGLALPLRQVNVFQDKLQLDLTEAALREGASNVAEYIRERGAFLIEEAFIKGSGVNK